jgi:hypothetical protein
MHHWHEYLRCIHQQLAVGLAFVRRMKPQSELSVVTFSSSSNLAGRANSKRLF